MCVSLLCLHVVVEIFTSALFTIPFTSVRDVYNVLVLQCISFKVPVSVFDLFFTMTLQWRGSRFRVFNNSQGLRNDLKDAMDKLDQEYLTQLALQQVHMMYTHKSHVQTQRACIGQLY